MQLEPALGHPIGDCHFIEITLPANSAFDSRQRRTRLVNNYNFGSTSRGVAVPIPSKRAVLLVIEATAKDESRVKVRLSKRETEKSDLGGGA